jgi:choline dehydrogenase
MAPRTDWDHIIVGAGSAGSALAARLSEDPDRRVLLLEAGGWDWRPAIHIPGMLYEAINNPRLNWKFDGEPDPSLNGRTLTWAAGRVLGGGSSINGMVFVRGLPADFDDWAGAGNPGWDWASMLPYFKRLEHWEGAPNPARGMDGPVHVRRFDQPSAVSAAALEAFGMMGTPIVDDYNAGITEGIGLTQASQRHGRRHSAALAYLHPARRRTNLVIRTGALVSGVILEGTRCVGVNLVGADGRTEAIRANGDVVLATGAIVSPKLLMLSGIGDPAQLRAHGVAVRHALPGVGANMNEHVNAFFSATVNIQTYDAIRHGPRRMLAGMRWLARRDGPASAPANQLQAYYKTDPSLASADVQIQTMPVGFGPQSAGQQGVTTVLSLTRPETRGKVSLRSSDPAAPPRIEISLLDSDRDIRTLIKAARYVRDVYQAAPMKKLVVRETMPTADVQSDAEWLAYFRETSRLNWHPTSTCRMGPGPDDVVDSRLRVRGVDNLRIADASIMPIVPSGNTNASCIAIGEKAADLIRDFRPGN